jgi:hypothetical protein
LERLKNDPVWDEDISEEASANWNWTGVSDVRAYGPVQEIIQSWANIQKAAHDDYCYYYDSVEVYNKIRQSSITADPKDLEAGEKDQGARAFKMFYFRYKQIHDLVEQWEFIRSSTLDKQECGEE